MSHWYRISGSVAIIAAGVVVSLALFKSTAVDPLSGEDLWFPSQVVALRTNSSSDSPSSDFHRTRTNHSGSDVAAPGSSAWQHGWLQQTGRGSDRDAASETTALASPPPARGSPSGTTFDSGRFATELDGRLDESSAAGARGSLGPAVPSAIRRWESIILDNASGYGIDPNLIAAVMMTESGGNPSATSPHGAVGLMQVLGGSYEPRSNVAQGARMLSDNLRHFNGDVELALAAYNAGQSAVTRYGGIPPYLETQNYVFEVLNRYYLYSAS